MDFVYNRTHRERMPLFVEDLETRVRLSILDQIIDGEGYALDRILQVVARK